MEDVVMLVPISLTLEAMVEKLRGSLAADFLKIEQSEHGTVTVHGFEGGRVYIEYMPNLEVSVDDPDVVNPRLAEHYRKGFTRFVSVQYRDDSLLRSVLRVVAAASDVFICDTFNRVSRGDQLIEQFKDC